MPMPILNAATENLPVQKVVGESIRTLADGAETGSFEVFLQSGDEGIGPPPHSHPWDEAYYVLAGRLEVLCGKEARVLPAGGFAFLPAGTVHCYKGVGGAARFLSITSKAGAAKFFRELDREAPEFPPLLDKVIPVAVRNQVMPAAPAGTP
jgi:quercetin dioxygenase-like cupin family protein